MKKLLSELAIGEGGKVVQVNGEGPVRRRLFDMGVTPGAEVRMRKSALGRSYRNQYPRI